MDYRQLGNSGVRVSVIGLGANRLGSENVPQTEVNKPAAESPVVTGAVEKEVAFAAER